VPNFNFSMLTACMFGRCVVALATIASSAQQEEKIRTMFLIGQATAELPQNRQSGKRSRKKPLTFPSTLRQPDQSDTVGFEAGGFGSWNPQFSSSLGCVR